MILIRSFLELNMALYHISKIKRAFYLTMVTPLFLRRNACVRKTIWMLRPLRYHINKVYVWLICWGPYWFDLYGNPTDQNSIIKTIKVRREADDQRLWRALKSVVCYCFRLKSSDGTTNGLRFISIRFIEYRQHTFISLLVRRRVCNLWTMLVELIFLSSFYHCTNFVADSVH